MFNQIPHCPHIFRATAPLLNVTSLTTVVCIRRIFRHGCDQSLHCLVILNMLPHQQADICGCNVDRPFQVDQIRFYKKFFCHLGIHRRMLKYEERDETYIQE